MLNVIKDNRLLAIRSTLTSLHQCIIIIVDSRKSCKEIAANFVKDAKSCAFSFAQPRETPDAVMGVTRKFAKEGHN